MGLLNNKTALITGASRGIGAAIAEKFASEGANVAFTYLLSEEKAMALATHLAGYGGKAIAYRSDAAQLAEAEELVKKVLEDFGSLHILVNNAGITKDNLLLRMSQTDWDAVINTNLKSVFNLTKVAMKPLMRVGGASIINLSSIIGLRGQAGQANYAASKAGIIGFSKSIAKEYGSRQVRCNVIAPGFIETDMTHSLAQGAKEDFLKNIPLGRLGSGEDIANAALFLGADLSRYVTGQVLSVCGGFNI